MEVQRVKLRTNPLYDSHCLIPLGSVAVCGTFTQCWTSCGSFCVFSLPRMGTEALKERRDQPATGKKRVVNSLSFRLSISYQRGHQPLSYTSRTQGTKCILVSEMYP